MFDSPLLLLTRTQATNCLGFDLRGLDVAGSQWLKDSNAVVDVSRLNCTTLLTWQPNHNGQTKLRRCRIKHASRSIFSCASEKRWRIRYTLFREIWILDDTPIIRRLRELRSKRAREEASWPRRGGRPPVLCPPVGRNPKRMALVFSPFAGDDYSPDYFVDFGETMTSLIPESGVVISRLWSCHVRHIPSWKEGMVPPSFRSHCRLPALALGFGDTGLTNPEPEGFACSWLRQAPPMLNLTFAGYCPLSAARFPSRPCFSDAMDTERYGVYRAGLLVSFCGTR